MLREIAAASLIILACETRPGSNRPDASDSSGGADAGPVSGGTHGDSAGASGAGAWVDTFDPSGCEHPEVVEDCEDGWCRIPPGCFIMGAPENEWGFAPEETRSKTTLTRGFLIMQTEVTQEQWTSLGLANPSRIYDSGPAAGEGDCTDRDCPVGNVNWFEAVSYANLLSEQEGLEPCYVLQECSGEIGVGYAGLLCTSFEINAPTLYECEGYRLPTDAECAFSGRIRSAVPAAFDH